MRQTALHAIMYGAGDLRLEERPIEQSPLAPDEVYVETEVTALSTGTDLGNYLGRSTDVPGAPDYPRAVGYSNVGVVRDVGSAVQRVAPGMRVFSMKPHLSAFRARDSEVLVPVPAGVAPEPASLAYLTQLGVAALRQVQYEPGESVATVGLGVIGLCTCTMARVMGAREVIAVANSAQRAQAALQAGAHRAVVNGQHPQPQDVDVVVLTANPWAAFRQSVEMVRTAGRVSILGFPGRGEAPPDFNPLDARWLYGKQLTLVGSGFSTERFSRVRNIEYIVSAMAHTNAFDRIISHRLPAAQMREAYELARLHDKSLQAAIFDWR
ncbi:MAG: zinc-binding alcohol dehydrogenase [Acidobacteria bacterium]|nr:zinc-binding alcohol dehydrogenase [Acidobacteriota bacterium]